MAIVSDTPQARRLARLGIAIRTEFWDGSGIRFRATDGQRRDDVTGGVIMNKKYFRGDRLLRREKAFNPMMMYTYVASGELSRQITCPNCGRPGTVADFVDGCPYCGTCYNVEYTARQAGGKFHGDKDVRDWMYYLLALVVCLGVCLPVSLAFFRATGRTFGTFDILKAVFYGLLVALALFYGFYVARAFVLTRRAEEKYERQNALIKRFETELLGLGMGLDDFYNNLTSELTRWFFDSEVPENRDVADWDVLDYDDFDIREDSQGRKNLSVTLTVRRIWAQGDRLRSRRERLRVNLRPNRVVTEPLKPGVNIIQCHNCGASIDVTQPACEHCGSRINYRQKLYLTEVERV